jgi:hypothetical protein
LINISSGAYDQLALVKKKTGKNIKFLLDPFKIPPKKPDLSLSGVQGLIMHTMVHP